MRYPVLVLRRSDLVAAGACQQWLEQFDAICAARGDATAPSVRRKDGTSFRDPSRLRIELTPLAQVWAARDARGAVEWLRMKGLWPSANLRGANLYGADLRGADLRGSKLVGERPILQIGPLGSRSDYLVAYLTDAGMMISAGCFFGTLDEFRAACDKTHGDSIHGREYAAAIQMIEAHALLWTPAEEAKEAA